MEPLAARCSKVSPGIWGTTRMDTYGQSDRPAGTLTPNFWFQTEISSVESTTLLFLDYSSPLNQYNIPTGLKFPSRFPPPSSLLPPSLLASGPLLSSLLLLLSTYPLTFSVMEAISPPGVPFGAPGGSCHIYQPTKDHTQHRKPEPLSGTPLQQQPDPHPSPKL